MISCPACGVMSARISPAATASPSLTVANVSTTPEQGALTTVSIFMALTTSSVSPALTSAPWCAAISTTVPAMGHSTLRWPSAGCKPVSPAVVLVAGETARRPPPLTVFAC